MLADLHIHSWYSDSTRSPKEIIKLAKENNIGLISLCDHNMARGYNEMAKLCKEAKINLILGSEINSLFEAVEFHVLAYDFDMYNLKLQELMKYNQDVMEDMGKKLITLAAKDYENISLEEFLTYKRRKDQGGWESIDYLKSKSILNNFGEYRNFCTKYEVERKNGFKSIKEVTDTVHKAGGKAVLAHAGDMMDNEPSKFKEMLPRLVEQGIDGFECYYTSHSEEVTKMLVEFCKDNNLLITAGSDDHGGFNNIIAGKEYYIGGIKVDTKELNLSGLKLV